MTVLSARCRTVVNMGESLEVPFPADIPHVSQRRAGVERALVLWVKRGALQFAGLEPERSSRYRVVTCKGREFGSVSLREAEMIVEACAAMSAMALRRGVW